LAGGGAREEAVVTLGLWWRSGGCASGAIIGVNSAREEAVVTLGLWWRSGGCASDVIIGVGGAREEAVVTLGLCERRDAAMGAPLCRWVAATPPKLGF
jgi:hypothetical protein